jgi:hypothetical protein
MMQMINKTRRAHKGRCLYGRKCCGSLPDMMGGQRKRRMLKRAERAEWKRSVLADA